MKRVGNAREYKQHPFHTCVKVSLWEQSCENGYRYRLWCCLKDKNKVLHWVLTLKSKCKLFDFSLLVWLFLIWAVVTASDESYTWILISLCLEMNLFEPGIMPRNILGIFVCLFVFAVILPHVVSLSKTTGELVWVIAEMEISLDSLRRKESCYRQMYTYISNRLFIRVNL